MKVIYLQIGRIKKFLFNNIPLQLGQQRTHGAMGNISRKGVEGKDDLNLTLVKYI